MRSSLVNGFFTQFFNRLLKCPIVSGSKVASTKIKNALKKLKSKKAKVSNGIKILRKIVKLLDAHPDPKKEFFGSLRRYYNYLKSQKRIKKLLKKKINKSKLQKKIVHLKTKLAKVNTIKKEMKQHIKMCLRTKGKFAKQFCKKVKELGRKFRKIAKKIYRKLKTKCKSMKTRCIHGGDKKFCRKAHHVCKHSKQLGKKSS